MAIYSTKFVPITKVGCSKPLKNDGIFVVPTKNGLLYNMGHTKPIMM